MQHPPNPTPRSRDVIKAAVKVAGGDDAVAAHFGITPQAVRSWQFKAKLPAHYVRQLSALGGGVVSVESLLAAIERTAADKVAA